MSIKIYIITKYKTKKNIDDSHYNFNNFYYIIAISENIINIFIIN
jgi:hypothetical protein